MSGLKPVRRAEPGVSGRLDGSADLRGLDAFPRRARYGARPLRRAIESFVEDPLAEELLKGEFVGKEPGSPHWAPGAFGYLGTGDAVSAPWRFHPVAVGPAAVTRPGRAATTASTEFTSRIAVVITSAGSTTSSVLPDREVCHLVNTTG